MTLFILICLTPVAALLGWLVAGEAHKRGQQKIEDDERVRKIIAGKDLEQ
jgi:hypothetical protein